MTIASGQINHKIVFSAQYSFDCDTLTNDEICTIIHYPGVINSSISGRPELPQKTLKFLLPDNATEPWIEIVNISIEEIVIDNPLKPGSEANSIDKIEGTLNFYPVLNKQEREYVYPETIVQVDGVGRMREFNIATVSVFPFQYYAVQKKLVFAKEIEFTLHYQIAGNNLTKKQFNDKNKIVQETICSYVVNKADFQNFYQPEDNNITSLPDKHVETEQLKSINLGLTIDCDYIVVASDDYVTELSELTAWKKRKGIAIEVVSLSNVLNNYSGDVVSGIYDNAGKLRQFLNDVYLNSQSFQYALFIDDGDIPIRYLHHHDNETDPEKIYPSDYYFADFDIDWEKDEDNNHGEIDDSIYSYEPEIFIGRLLIQNANELRNWIRKAILYETDPGKGNRNYLTKAYFTDADHLRSEHITDKLTWCNDVKVDFELGGYNTLGTPSFPKGSDVINEFNNHYGVSGFCAHGNPTTVATATKGMNLDEPLSKYGVTSLDEYNSTSNSGCCLIPENGNGFDNMTNKDYPTIFLSIACKTMPFDDFGHSSNIRNMGESYTVISEGGGPVYIGNTRDGYAPNVNFIIGEMMRMAGDTTFHNLGKLMGIAKESDYYDGYVKYTMNYLGCPEIELWTAIPYPFQGITVSQSGSNVTISSRERGAKFTVMSALDNGSSYYQVRQEVNTDSWTFTNVPGPYLVTVTKHNFIPFIQNPDNLYFQNETVYTEKYIYAENVYAGENVTTLKPQGVFKIMNGANVTFDASNEIYLEHGFEVALGGIFEAK